MKKAGDVISNMLKEMYGAQFVEAGRLTAGLFSSWAQIVAEAWPQEDAPAAGANSRIQELERGQLLVEADHPGWIQILRTKEKELLSIVQRRYPQLDIKDISFRLSRKLSP